MSELSISSVKIWRTVVLWALTIVMVGFIAVIYLLFENLHSLTESGEKRYQSYLLADELRQSSDDLTRMVRTFAATGDERFEAQFKEVLAIRNGERPRPQNYNRIYWDFLAVQDKLLAGDGDKHSLQDLMVTQGIADDELALLRQAQRQSDALTTLEEVAVRAVNNRLTAEDEQHRQSGESNQEMAIRLLHGAEYHQAKVAIMEPIQMFLTKLEERTETEYQSFAKHTKSLIILCAAFVVLTSILVLMATLLGQRISVYEHAILTDAREEGSKAEQALRESEERFGAFAKYTPNKLHIKDAEGRYILINRKSEELFGVTNEEAKGKTATDIFPSKMSKNFDLHDRTVMETGEPVEAEEVFLLDDSVYTYLTVKFPILGADGDIVAVGSSGFEITERKRAEEEIIRHRDHLEVLVNERTADVKEKAVQLEDVLAREKEYSSLQQKFTSLVSHELRTPLSIIDGAAQRLIRRKGKLAPDELETKANKVRSAVARMIRLIDTTLYVTALDSGKIDLKLTPCNIRELVREICDRQAEVSASHEIQVEVDDLPSEIIADTARIDQVFTNLLSNAVKFAPEAPLIEVKGWVDGGNALVSINDRGVGIPEDDLPQMFKRFFRAKTAEGIKGTGIGLSVVKEFVEMHSGTIEVTSTEGEGSTFTVCLPIGDRD